jgi:threonine/homoserine/homoserine lactone efflux protein
MLDVLGQVLAPSVAVALSPFPLIAVVPVLVSPGGRMRGVVFLGGWLAGLVLLSAIAVIVIGVLQSNVEGDSTSLLPAWIELLAGLALVTFGVRKWRGHVTRGAHAAPPAWMERLSTSGTLKTAVIAFLLAAANPKIIVFAVGAMSAVAILEPTAAENSFAVAAFAVIGSIGTAVPVGIAIGMRDRSEQLLGALGHWLSSNDGAIMGTLLLVIGAGLVGDALTAIG